jgi:hypothetical protein
MTKVNELSGGSSVEKESEAQLNLYRSYVAGVMGIDWTEISKSPTAHFPNYLINGYCLDPYLLAQPDKTEIIRSILLNVLSNEVSTHKLNKLLTSNAALSLIYHYLTAEKFIDICSTNPRNIAYVFSDKKMLEILNFGDFLELSSKLSDSAAANLLSTKNFASQLKRFLDDPNLSKEAIENAVKHAHPLFLKTYSDEFKTLAQGFIKDLTLAHVFGSNNPGFIDLAMQFEEIQLQVREMKNKAQPSLDLESYSGASLSYAQQLLAEDSGQAIADSMIQNLAGYKADGNYFSKKEEFMAQLTKTSPGFLITLMNKDSENAIHSRLTEILNQDYKLDKNISKLINDIIISKNYHLLSLVLANENINSLMLISSVDFLTKVISKDHLNETEKTEFVKVILSSYSEALSETQNLYSKFDKKDHEEVLTKLQDDLEAALSGALDKQYDLIIVSILDTIGGDYFPTSSIAQLKEHYHCELFRGSTSAETSINENGLAKNDPAHIIFNSLEGKLGSAAGFSVDTSKTNPNYCIISYKCRPISDIQLSIIPMTVTVSASPNPSEQAQLPATPQLGSPDLHHASAQHASPLLVKVCYYEPNSFYSTAVPAISIAAGLGIGIGVPLALGAPWALAIHLGAASAFKVWNDISSKKIKKEGAVDKALPAPGDHYYPEIDGVVYLDGTLPDSASAIGKRGPGSKRTQIEKSALLTSGKSSVDNDETPHKHHDHLTRLSRAEKAEYKVRQLEKKLAARPVPSSEESDSTAVAKHEDSAFAAHAKMSLALKGAEILAESGVIGAAVGLTAHYLLGVPLRVVNCEKVQLIKQCHVPNLIKANVIKEVLNGEYPQLVYTDLNKLLAFDNMPCSDVTVVGAALAANEADATLEL